MKQLSIRVLTQMHKNTVQIWKSPYLLPSPHGEGSGVRSNLRGLHLYLILLLLIGCGTCASLQAQTDLQISKVFDQYGKQKGVVMVNLTNENVDGYDFSLFKSITITNNPSAVELIQKCLELDETLATQVKKVMSEGLLASIALQLPRKGQLYRLILYRNEAAFKREPKISLIYIESKTNSENILKYILKKK